MITRSNEALYNVMFLSRMITLRVNAPRKYLLFTGIRLSKCVDYIFHALAVSRAGAARDCDARISKSAQCSILNGGAAADLCLSFRLSRSIGCSTTLQEFARHDLSFFFFI